MVHGPNSMKVKMNYLRRRRLEPWLNPRESIARQINTGTKAMSRSRAWFARGPARETYENNIYAEVDAILAVIQPPEGTLLFVRLYMIGRDEDSANPVVMVCCVNRETRKEAELLIRKSGILDRFPGFGLGSSAMLLESMGPEKLVTMVRTPNGYGVTQMKLTSAQRKDYQQKHAQTQGNFKGSTDSITKIYEESPLGPGARIRIERFSDGEVSLVHEATAGPIFQLGADFYQITAGHGIRLNSAEGNTDYSPSELDECEFDGQWDSSDEIATDRGSKTPEDHSPASSDDNTNRTSNSDVEDAEGEQKTVKSSFAWSSATRLLQELPGSAPATAMSSISSQGSRGVISSTTAKHVPGSPLPTVKTEPDASAPQQNIQGFDLVRDFAEMDLQLHNPDLDYILLKLPTQCSLSDPASRLKIEADFQNQVKDISHVVSEDTRVIVASRDGAIPGYISPETIPYKMSGFTRLQKLMAVRLEGLLHEGYSGSAVIDAATGMLYGQIVLGSPGDALAYCTCSSDIFADIVSKLGRFPVFDEKKWEPNCLLAQDFGGTVKKTTNTVARTYIAKSEGKAPMAEAKEHEIGIICDKCDENTNGFQDEDDLRHYTEAKHDSPYASVRGGYDPGTDGFNAVDSMETGYSPLRTHGPKRKRGKEPPLPSKSSAKGQATRTLACPYYLYDRIRHSDCLNTRLRRLSDVREHVLERAHNQVVHCPACGITFPGRTSKARQQRDAHVRAEICEPSPLPFNYPGITEDEDRRIREIARHTRTTQYNEVQRWFTIWDFLFPGEPRPDSPYLTELPEIQRVVDWRNVIFNKGLLRDFPTEPWTTTMPSEAQRSGMFNIIDSFIEQARGLVGQNSAPVEDDHRADSSSFIEIETPQPSSTIANPRVAPMASFDSNLSVEASRPTYLTPVLPTRLRQSRNSRTLDPVDSGTLESPADVAPNSPQPLNDSTVEVPQDTQQGVTPEEATDISDPNIPLLVFEDFSAEDLILDIPLPWAVPVTGNDNTGTDDS